MIVFAHTKFGLVRIQGSEVKSGAESPPVRAIFWNPCLGRVKRRLEAEKILHNLYRIDF